MIKYLDLCRAEIHHKHRTTANIFNYVSQRTGICSERIYNLQTKHITDFVLRFW